MWSKNYVLKQTIALGWVILMMFHHRILFIIFLYNIVTKKKPSIVCFTRSCLPQSYCVVLDRAGADCRTMRQSATTSSRGTTRTAKRWSPDGHNACCSLTCLTLHACLHAACRIVRYN